MKMAFQVFKPTTHTPKNIWFDVSSDYTFSELRGLFIHISYKMHCSVVIRTVWRKRSQETGRVCNDRIPYSAEMPREDTFSKFLPAGPTRPSIYLCIKVIFCSARLFFFFRTHSFLLQEIFSFKRKENSSLSTDAKKWIPSQVSNFQAKKKKILF